MTSIRTFTKHDWDAFAGAECFENGSQPLIFEAELNDGQSCLTVIADRTGLEIYIQSVEEYSEDVWSKGIKNLSPLRARGEMEHLISYFNRSEYTHAPNIAYELDHPSDKITEGFQYC